jgi:hypothetical protein
MTEGFLSDQMLVVDVRERTEGSLGATTNGEGSMATAMQGSRGHGSRASGGYRCSLFTYSFRHLYTR